MKQLAVITALLIALTSFRTATIDSVDLYNIKWQLKSIHHKDEVSYIYTNAFVSFDETKKRISGNGSCNTFGGSLEVKDNFIRFGQLFSTRMYCEQAQKIETDFFAALSKVTRYEIKGNSLLLYQGEQLVLEFGSMNDN